MEMYWLATNPCEIVYLLKFLDDVFQDPQYLYDPNNETAGNFVPAQILFDAFYGRYHTVLGAVLMLIIIWGSFFFGGLATTTSAARIVSIRVWPS